MYNYYTLCNYPLYPIIGPSNFHELNWNQPTCGAQSELVYLVLPSGQIIKNSILSVIPIKNNRWKIKFYDTNKTIILDKDDGLALTKMLVGIYGI